MARRLERAIRRPEQEVRYAGMDAKREIRNELAYNEIKNMMGQFYQGVDPRRRQEMADAGMIREDHTAMANLSPVPIHQEMRRVTFYGSPYIDALLKD